MTLKNSPIAIDGALIDSATLRANTYAATEGSEGVVNSGDMKVTQLTVPGNGVSIAGGSALVLNRYQDEADLNETYSVVDLGGTNLGPSDMPPAVGAPQSHLVCVTIGDPEFSQVGHPWMMVTDPPAGTEETFQYVRYFVIQNVPSSTESFEELNLNYPAYAVARLDIPASTTTITNAMIVDLREIAQPKMRQLMLPFTTSASAQNSPEALAIWPAESEMDIKIPSWATVMKIQAALTGLGQWFIPGNTQMKIVVTNVGEASYPTGWQNPDTDASTGGVTVHPAVFADELPIPEAYRGTTQTISMKGVGSPGSAGWLKTNVSTRGYYNIVFEQEPA